MPLTLVKPGETVTVLKLAGRDEVRQHLAELGVVVGAVITVVSKISGSLILQVKGGRIALDRALADRIMVSL